MKPANEELYEERHKEMLEFQKKHWPWTPTVRQLAGVFGVKSTAPVIHILEGMEERGMVITQECGKKRQFFAIRRKRD